MLQEQSNGHEDKRDSDHLDKSHAHERTSSHFSEHSLSKSGTELSSYSSTVAAITPANNHNHIHSHNHKHSHTHTHTHNHSHHKNTTTTTTTATTTTASSTATASRINRMFGGASFPTSSKKSGQGSNKNYSPVQKRMWANLLRLRIERGLMVGMALLAGYRMMTLDYSNTILDQPQSQVQLQDQKETLWKDSTNQYPQQYPHYHQQQQRYQNQSHQETMSDLAKSAWALAIGFILLATIHAIFLTAHDHQLQFPLHNKNLPLQPLRKRASRQLNVNASQDIVAAIVAESDEESEDDEAHQKDIAAVIQQENLLQSQESTRAGISTNNTDGPHALAPVKWQNRICRSAEIAAPQWRVWGSEANWYRRGADNGSIFATVLVPIVLAAKFVQTVTDEHFLSTGVNGIYTAKSVLSNMAFSLIFGTSILVHMLLLKAFDQIGTGSSKRTHQQQQLWRKKFMGATRSTILDNIALPSPMMATSTSLASISTSSLSTSTKVSHPKPQNSAVSSPSSPSSPTLSAASSTPSTAVQQPYGLQKQKEIPDLFMFSADQLHHPSLLVGTSEFEKASDREEIWIIALGFGGAYNCLVALLARLKWLPGLEDTGAGMVMLTHSVFQLLLFGFAYFFRRSFTFGELVILTQAVMLLIREALIMAFIKAPSSPGTILEHPQFMFLLTLVVGMLLIGVLLMPALVCCRTLAQRPAKGTSASTLQRRELKKKIAAGVVYAGLVAIVLGVLMPLCERILGQNPFVWVIEFLLMSRIFSSSAPELLQPGQSPVSAETKANLLDIKFGLETLMRARIGWSRLALCLYWVLAIGCSIAFFYWINTSIRRRSIMGSLNNRRKFYHALAVVMFIPGYLADEPFMHIAFSVALAALIFLEYIRCFAVVPFGKEIHLFLVGFLDARDGGPIILSHLYLLMGCAAPVWLAEQHILAGLSGIFALGVGDAMASIVGKRFGRHRWPGTIKTVEGTVAFVASMMVAAGAVFVGMWLMSFVFGDGTSPRSSSLVLVSNKAKQLSSSSMPPASLLSFSTWNDWSSVTWSVWGIVRYGMAVSVAAMLEAVSEQNDNLVIPVTMLSMVWLI